MQYESESRSYGELDDDERWFYHIQNEKLSKKLRELADATRNQAPKDEYERLQAECRWLHQTVPGFILGNTFWPKWEPPK